MQRVICILFIFLSISGCMKMQWDSASTKNTKAAYEDFLRQYPNSEFTSEAKLKIETINFKEAEKENTLESYEKFIKCYPSSQFVGQAKSNIESISFQQAKEVHTTDGYEKFIGHFPNSKYLNEAQSKLENLLFQKAKDQNTIEFYEKFIDRFPNSVLKNEAQQNLEILYYTHFDKAKKTNTVSAFEDFLGKHPKSKYCADAVMIAEQLYYQKAVDEKTIIASENYLKKYPDGKYKKEVKNILIPLLRPNHTTEFTNSFNKLFENYFTNLSPTEMVHGIKGILNQYEYADKAIRDLSVAYLNPFQELAQIEKELSKSEKVEFKTILKDIAFAWIGGWNSIISAWSRLTGKDTTKTKIEKINNKFLELKEKSNQVAHYLAEKYNIELHVGNWDVQGIINK